MWGKVAIVVLIVAGIYECVREDGAIDRYFTLDYSDYPCDYCRRLDDIRVPRRDDELTQDEWTNNYGYSGRPVIVDLTKGSMADDELSWADIAGILGRGQPNFLGLEFGVPQFEYISEDAPTRLQSSFAAWMRGEPEQFFGYKLHGVLSPPGKEIGLDWYMRLVDKWPNDKTLMLLQQRLNYTKLPFLPFAAKKQSPWIGDTLYERNFKTKFWLFVGLVSGPDPIAGLDEHIDNVGFSGTFHLQLMGTKRWRLRPLKHCRAVCGDHIDIDIHAGQFLSLSTDKWYHQTWLLPDGMSEGGLRSSNDDGLVVSIAYDYSI